MRIINLKITFFLCFINQQFSIFFKIQTNNTFLLNNNTYTVYPIINLEFYKYQILDALGKKSNLTATLEESNQIKQETVSSNQIILIPKTEDQPSSNHQTVVPMEPVSLPSFSGTKNLQYLFIQQISLLNKYQGSYLT